MTPRFGPALTRSSRSFSDLIGDLVGTTTMLYSPVSRASGVTSASVTFDRLVAKDATMPKPPTIMASLRPDLLRMNCASPMAPPAPPTLMTVMPLPRPSFSMVAWSAREVRS